MNAPPHDVVFLVMGATVLLYGAVSRFLKQYLSLSEAVVGLALGIVLGPVGLDLASAGDLSFGEPLFFEATRLAVGMQVVATALRIPNSYLRRPHRLVFVLLGLALPLAWVVTGVIAWGLTGLPFWSAMLLGALLAPTDPVLITSIVTGTLAEREIPFSIRSNLSAESCANDSLAFPLVTLCLFVLAEGATEGLGDWAVRSLLRETVGGLVAGVVAGYAFGKLLVWADAHDAHDKRSFLVFTVAFSVLVLGGSVVAGLGDLLAVFAGGWTFSLTVQGPDRSRAELVEHVLDRIITIPIFAVFGIVLPWSAWGDLGAAGVGFVIAVLVARRLPAMAALKRLHLSSWPDTLMLGWFGPIGVGALFYVAYVERHGGPDLWAFASLAVFASTVAHGFSAVPLTHLYSRRARLSR